VRFVRAKLESQIIKALSELEETDLIIFHHRIPTSSPNTAKANHPILIENKKLENKYYLVHNGHITNSDELKKDHEKIGFSYQTNVLSHYKTLPNQHYSCFTDSESLGVELALYIEGKKEKVEAIGGVACFLLQVNRDNIAIKFFSFRNSNPIKMYSNQNGVFLSSSGKGEEVKSDTLFELDLSTFKITKRKLKIAEWAYSRDTESWRRKSWEEKEDEGEVLKLVSGEAKSDYIDSYLHVPEVKEKYDKLLELDTEKMELNDELKALKKTEGNDGDKQLLESELIFISKEVSELRAEIYTLIANYNYDL
ncbi:MAG: hypothetical protein AAB875_06765, partial [Patescibacteria group bacterium]